MLVKASKQMRIRRPTSTLKRKLTIYIFLAQLNDLLAFVIKISEQYETKNTNLVFTKMHESYLQ